MDLRSERDALDALAVGKANRIANKSRLIAPISFQATVASKGSENHIDDCVQLIGKILTDLTQEHLPGRASGSDETTPCEEGLSIARYRNFTNSKNRKLRYSKSATSGRFELECILIIMFFGLMHIKKWMACRLYMPVKS